MSGICLLLLLTVTVGGLESDARIERLARKYRIRVYNTFRTNRLELDRRNQIAEKLIQDWKNGSREFTADEVADWFIQATNNLGRSNRHLPPFPDENRPAEKSKTYRDLVNSAHRWPAEAARKNTSITATRPQTDTAMDSVLEIDLSLAASPPSPTPKTAQPIHRKGAIKPQPVLPISDPKQTPSSNNEKINISVLTARIESENLLFKSIESRLHDSRVFDNDELSLIVQELDLLIQRQQMSGWYFDILSARKQQFVPTMFDKKPVLVLLGQRLFETETNIVERYEKSKSKSDQHLLNELRKLSRRVQSWED